MLRSKVHNGEFCFKMFLNNFMVTFPQILKRSKRKVLIILRRITKLKVKNQRLKRVHLMVKTVQMNWRAIYLT